MENSKGGVSSSLEMHTMGSVGDQSERTSLHEARDNGELERTGKKPVLKVCDPYQLLTSLLLQFADSYEAQLWLHVHLKLELLGH